MTSSVQTGRQFAHGILRAGDVVFRLLHVRQSDDRIIADAQRYWAESAPGPDEYHWRGGTVIDEGRFDRLGQEHLALFDRLACGFGEPDRLGRVLEWGCGGGANAVAFAPRADAFVAVDVAPAAVRECARQVAAVCDTPVVERVVDVARPEVGAAAERAACDLVICTYVIELFPGQEFARRMLRVLADVLVDDGLAFLHFRYDDGALRHGSRRYGYRLNPATMTSFRLEEFWTAAADAGLDPLVMTLVPRNDLDERYAFVLLRRAARDAGPEETRARAG